MSTIKSTFKTDAEGWTSVGDAQTFGWQQTGGNPDGYLAWTDSASGVLVYYDAPAKYHGDLSAFYKGKLSYDIFDSAGELGGEPDVKIVGANGVTLVAALGQAGAAWTHESIGLKTGQGWHVGTLTGAEASKADIKGVLANVVDLQIRAEYHSGGEAGGLDNVVLKSKTLAAVAPDAFGADHHAAEGPMAGFVAHHAIADGLALA